MAVLGPGLGVAMFLAASRAAMAPAAVMGLIVAAGVVFCLAERYLNVRERSLVRGLGSGAVFCLTLSGALWFTTGHPGVLMWVVLTTSACSAATTVAGRHFTTSH